jgi:7,8-dihydropterin-6-yl-methyl-4-(beta-D-ribofuranosyl)aminobenzene 5'-phosphate synthase
MRPSQPLGTPRKLESLSITIITDNYYDALRPDTVVSKRYRTTPGGSIHAEHGLSYFIETATENGESAAFMFDYGVDPDGVAKNIGALNIDLAKLKALGLSHGHFDHFGALVGLLGRNLSKIPKGTPLYVGKEAFAHRYAVRPGGDGLHDLNQLNREELEGLGILRIVEVSEPTEIAPGAYLTGTIERVVEYERVAPIFLVERGDKLEQDRFDGEQAVVFSVKEKGLVVLSGCAHAGIVNTVKHAQKMTGVSHLHAVIGGFHLINAAPEIIEATVADVKALAPDYVVPTHCTGFEAMVRFREEMPDQFLLNTAGTTYVFGS